MGHFYTHEVEDDFGPWGTSIDDFEWVVKKCKADDFDVLRVDCAVDNILSFDA